MTLLTTQELQDKLSVSRAGINKLIKLGMPVLRITRRMHRYDSEAVDQWLKEQSDKYAGLDELPDTEESEEIQPSAAD